MKECPGLSSRWKIGAAIILSASAAIILPLAGCGTKTSSTIVETNEPPDSTATISWQQAPSYKGLDVLVTVTGPIVGSDHLLPSGVTVWMGAQLGVGLDLYFSDASLFDPSWVGKTLTVVGEIINSPYESQELDITSLSQIISVK
jgi:hypothetical protein